MIRGIITGLIILGIYYCITDPFWNRSSKMALKTAKNIATALTMGLVQGMEEIENE